MVKKCIICSDLGHGMEDILGVFHPSDLEFPPWLIHALRDACIPVQLGLLVPNKHQKCCHMKDTNRTGNADG